MLWNPIIYVCHWEDLRERNLVHWGACICRGYGVNAMNLSQTSNPKSDWKSFEQYSKYRRRSNLSSGSTSSSWCHVVHLLTWSAATYPSPNYSVSYRGTCAILPRFWYHAINIPFWHKNLLNRTEYMTPKLKEALREFMYERAKIHILTNMILFF